MHFPFHQSSPIMAEYHLVLGKQEIFKNNLNDKVNHASIYLCEGLRAQKQASFKIYEIENRPLRIGL